MLSRRCASCVLGLEWFGFIVVERTDLRLWMRFEYYY